jgi:hypothetical protein
MPLSFESFDKEKANLPKFRELVKKYLRDLNIKNLFIPPPEMILKVASSRYNDGGEVKRDFQRPEKSFESGFLYQSFNPKPLSTREVWLPDKSTKINNAFWMIIGRQILKSDPIYPDDDPKITHERIKHKLKYFIHIFDISGFGLQYPRELLAIVAEEIVRLFPNPDLFEARDIFKRILSSVKVEMPDGTFVYPPRGIGLGYYEDLKTIGMMALLKPHNPVSVYGDQGILGLDGEDALQDLKDAGFIIKEGKSARHVGPVKWSGWIMTPLQCIKPRERWHGIVSLFQGEYHWERKQILRSYATTFEDFYKKNDRKISFYYELFFGHEFRRGDSLGNFQNSGVSLTTLPFTGKLKGWQVDRMVAPTDTIIDNYIYESPFFTEWKRADAKKFSIKRKETYRRSLPCSTELVEYVNPRLEMHKSIVPKLNPLARAISDSNEVKLLVNYGLSTGKFTFGLHGNELLKALSYCSRARNPFEAYATGGYSVKTVWRCPPLASAEWIFLTEHILTSIDGINKSIYTRLDIDEMSSLVAESSLLKRKEREPEENLSQDTEENDRLGHRKFDGPKITVSMIDMVNRNTRSDESMTVIQPAMSLLEDLRNRQTNDQFLDNLSDYGSGDEDIFLESFDEDDEELFL